MGGLADTHDDLQAAIAGSKEARGRLLERLRPRLVLWAAGRLSPALRAQVEPEDIAQEVLIAVHKGMETYVGTDDRAFYRWLFTIGENRIRDLADRVGALKRKLPPPKPFTQTSPSGAAGRREEVARMMRALQGLSDSHREVIVLVRMEERPVADVAKILGKTPNAVRVLYCRALKELRDVLVDGASRA